MMINLDKNWIIKSHRDTHNEEKKSLSLRLFSLLLATVLKVSFQKGKTWQALSINDVQGPSQNRLSAMTLAQPKADNSVSN